MSTSKSKKSTTKPNAKSSRKERKLLPAGVGSDRRASLRCPSAEVRDAPPSAIAVPASGESKQATSAPPAATKPRARTRKPVRIGDALRQRGFDEDTIADHYVYVARRLKGKSDKSGGVEKLLVDVLKECSKFLEPAKPPERTGERLGASGAPIHVHLVHSVTRPARDARGEAPAPSGRLIGPRSNPARSANSTAEPEPDTSADAAA